jgi:hypothetical protein
LTIVNRQVTAFSMPFRTHYGNASCTETLTLTSPVAISGNTVRVTGRTPSLGPLSVDITFSADKAATGVLGDMTGNGLICISTGTFVAGGNTVSLGGPWTFAASRP